MGLRYFLFRIKFAFKQKTGLLKRSFPTQGPQPKAIDWSEFANRFKWLWKSNGPKNLIPTANDNLKSNYVKLLNNEHLLFFSIPHQFNGRESWIIHPETGYQYPKNRHWTEIADMSKEAGDIKFVWERSRFGFLTTIIRHDAHFGTNSAEWVWSQLAEWMEMNPINSGPNFRCSQEISLRLFHWFGVLAFYKTSHPPDEILWKKLQYYFYWQLDHVWKNIDFSRIAVRNNHAITECLALYIGGTIFPEWNEKGRWKELGKKWFEEEVLYQIYADGSYLQFSMNYHRVVVQLLTLAFRFAEINGDKFSESVYQRADQTLRFLRTCQDPVSGLLPNYGANDGALFFYFSDQAYNDFNPSLEALERALYGASTIESPQYEEAYWFGSAMHAKLIKPFEAPSHLHLFGLGGFASIQEHKQLTFFRSGRHLDRPSQADNLHVDLWHNGWNIFRDAGSYKYNSSESDISFFFGTKSHNTLMINHQDQMLKGPRFVWLYWSQAIALTGRETTDEFIVMGEIEAFRHIKKGLRHKRVIKKWRDKPIWEIEDTINGPIPKNCTFQLLWHPHPEALQHFEITVTNGNGINLKASKKPGFYSGLYGKKEESPYLEFSSELPTFKTLIQPKPTP